MGSEGALRGAIVAFYRAQTAPLNGWLSKLCSLVGSLLQYGTYYLGYPKRDFNFENYPKCSFKP